MLARIVQFEFRYQTRGPVFWAVAVLFFLLTFASVTVDQIQIAGGANIHRNSPSAIIQIHLVLSLFFLFVTTAFVANVILRDDESGFGGIVRATPVRKLEYVFGRFIGAILVACAAYVALPFAIWAGSLMPWIDPETLGPFRIQDYLFAYFVLGVGNIIITGSLLFAAATMSRSMAWSQVIAMIFLVLWGLSTTIARNRPELRPVMGLLEPLGFSAFGNVARYWSAAESNSRLPDLAGPILVNRAIWLGVAGAALALAYARFSFTQRPASARQLRKQASHNSMLSRQQPLVSQLLPAPRPSKAAWARFSSLCRLEVAAAVRNPGFIAIVMLGIFNALGGLAFGLERGGAQAYQRTVASITILNNTFAIFPYIVAIYYAGELVWRDREQRIHEIIDATALPNWAYLLPKIIAVALALFVTLIVSVLVSIIFQLARGFTDLELGQYVFWYVLPNAVDFLILAVLAVFIQGLSPNKYVGWGVTVVYVITTITLTNLGFGYPLYNYGATGTLALSDMNGAQIGGATGWWLRLYWGAFAVVLAVIAHLLWRRGTEARLLPRLRQLPRRSMGMAGALIVAALLLFAGSGAFLHHNFSVLNTYRTPDDSDRELADYEKKYLQFETVLQPSTTAVRLNVALFPAERRMEATGTYAFVNDTGRPLRDLHFRLSSRKTRLLDAQVPGARLFRNDAETQYRIYRFDRPLAPGSVGTVRFRTARSQPGLIADDEDTRLVRNGTFLDNSEIAPVIGMDRGGLLSDPVKRRRYGLVAQLRPAKLENIAATNRNYFADADWVTSDITVSTAADQVPIAPGRIVADTIAGGRRTTRFVSAQPILNFFSVQSASYATASADAGGGVRSTIYYDPRHSYNVARMQSAVKRSLDYYRANFGPYQFDYARIIEFPGYADFAQAFAGTVPYSESIGFVIDTRDSTRLDWVTYVTAHEFAHQYWGHQIASADMQGGTIWVETLAQYSAMMVLKQRYGDDMMRRYLKYELDSYLRSRGGESVEELPLDRVENQGYIHYRKGSLVMYLLQDRLGEARVNAMLASQLRAHRFRSQPYVRSTDLVRGFMGLARTPQQRELVLDLLDRITLYDLKVISAATKPVGGGRFETTMIVEAHKFYADGKGEEREQSLVDAIPIGLFDALPGYGAFRRADVIAVERQPVRSGRQRLRIVSTRRPAYAGIDPYNYYIDRNSDDNVIAVE